jgi:predicted Zn-dependent protease
MSLERILAIFTLAMGLGLVTGCATHPVTGRSQLMLLPESNVIRMSYQAYHEMTRKEPILAREHPHTQRVNRIAQRIMQQAQAIHPSARGWEWEISVFRNDSINAFAMAGGKMGVNTGLIERMKPSDDELAQVIAHEVAHVISGHTREKMSIAMSQQLGLGLGGAALGLDASTMQLAGMVSQVALTLPFSRTMEYEADRVGLELAARAGYTPQAAITFWRRMMQTQKGAQPPEWLSTHPADTNRLAAIERLVPRMMPLYQQARR